MKFYCKSKLKDGRADGRKRASAGTQNLRGNSLQQPHFRQKEDEFGNEINNGELKTLVTKKKKRLCSQNTTLIVLKNSSKVYAQQVVE